MKIEFKTNKLQKTCENYQKLTAKCGEKNARKIIQRINELQAAPSLADMPPTARTHTLSGKRKGQFAVSVIQPFRLIFVPTGEHDIKLVSTIKSIKIISISEDYH